MSHQLEYPLINPEPEWEYYYYVPLLDRNEFTGIEYDSIQYGWQELDYRFDVPYPAVPEPAFVGLAMGLVLLTLVIFKK